MVAVRLRSPRRGLIPCMFRYVLLAAVDGMAEDTIEVAFFLQQRVAYVGSPGTHALPSAGLVADADLASILFRQTSFDDAFLVGRPRMEADAAFAEMAVVAEVAAEGAEFSMAHILPAEGYIHDGSAAFTGSLVSTGASSANPVISHQPAYLMQGGNDSDGFYGEASKRASTRLAPPTRNKIALLCIELPLGLFGIDRLFLGALWSGLMRLIVSFSAARLAVLKGCGTLNTSLLAWGPWGAADLAVILANALQRETSIDALGMHSVFEPSSLEAAGKFGVFVAVLYAYFLCKILSVQRPEAKIGYGVPHPERFGVGGVLQTEQGESHEVREDIDGDVPSSTFAVPGTTAEVISHATAILTQQAAAVKDPECSADPSCVVCYEALEEGDNVRVLPCFHRFHVGCVDQWLVRSRTCPVCKQDITC